MKQDNLNRNIDNFSSSSYVGQYLRPTAERMKRSAVVWAKSFAKPDPELEFLPAALEVLETPVSPIGRTTLLLICLFFMLAIVWSYFGHVDIISTSTGKIIPTGHTKIIQPFETGVIRAIHVQDGQNVKAGDVLIEIDTTVSESERDRLQNELITKQLEIARLNAALKLSENPVDDFIAPPGATPQQIELQKSQLITQVQSIQSKLLGLDQQISQNIGNRTAVKATIEKLVRSIPLLQERSSMRQTLSDKGYGSKLDTLSAKQDLVEHKEELEVQKARLEEASGGVASLEKQKEQAEAEYKQKNLEDLTDAEQKAATLQEQLIQATQKYKLQTLASPIDGTVQQLMIHTQGGVVTPAQALLAIVPKDSHLEIEANIPNRDIGFVHEGQDAQIKIDTFNFTKYGFIHGHVLSVSQDAVTHDKNSNPQNDSAHPGTQDTTSEPNGQELVYQARVSMDKSKMMADNHWINLLPGMAVTVEIKTGKQRIIEYLLSPIYKNSEEALHER
jgi:hemolysin D